MMDATLAPFVVGVNTIVVPRSIFLDSKLEADLVSGEASRQWPLADAPLYGEDLSQASVSESVMNVIALSLSGADAYNVLSRLLRNATNVQVYSYVDVTSYVLLVNLPYDVVRILPWAKVTNGATGAAPDGMPGFVNVLVQLGQMFYDGLVALVTFLVNLAEAIVDWGMKALGAVWEKIVGVVQNAGEVLNQFVDSFVRGIRLIFEAFAAQLRGLWESLAGGYLSNINDATTLTVSDYEGTGTIRPSSAAALRGAYTGGLFQAFLGIAIAAVAAYLVYVAATMGLGTLLGAVSGMIATTVATQVFGIGLTSFNVGAGFSPSWGLSQVAHAFLQWLVSSGWIDPGLESLTEALWGAALGTGSVIAALFGIAMLDGTASTATAFGLFFGILSLGLSFGIAVGGIIGKAMAFDAALFGFLGVFFSLVAITKAPILYQLVNLAGIVLGSIGVYRGITYATS